MSEFSLKKPDNYAIHLANMGSSAGVMATRDIYNEQGTLLIKKGNAIKEGSARLLLNHKLVQPLETSISIADSITPARIFDDMKAMLHADSESLTIHKAMRLDDTLQKYCSRAMSFPLIAQKMTVLASRLKFEYDKALFCAWFSMALAAQMSASSDFIEEAFIAGLVHDTGLLHIDPALAEKVGEYTPEEWRAIQSHTLIADLFLSYVEKLSPNIKRAVREHHERCDGSGYPYALCEEKLCITGQLVGMADTVWAICKKPKGRKGVTLADVITITKMNKAQHPSAIESALFKIYYKISANGQSPAHPPVTADSKDKLREKGQQLQEAYYVATRLEKILLPSETDRIARSAYVKFNRLWNVFNGSGLLTPQTLKWLETDTDIDSETLSYDLYQLSLMYSEFEWQLFQFARVLQQVVNHAKSVSATNVSIIESVIVELSSVLVRPRVASGDSTLCAKSA